VKAINKPTVATAIAATMIAGNGVPSTRTTPVGANSAAGERATDHTSGSRAITQITANPPIAIRSAASRSGGAGANHQRPSRPPITVCSVAHRSAPA